ncbi:hypothetical protein Poli38472_012341 [Pythium oligandrum]|uniref:Uncharacterized protein n=1 Tax=Pythium oligandrum TaxID=41045 RepID=A0A8K1CPP8_PYTOL|nr:hypothetical protein Poli38472_012341 [Pythium oligandrum]|eukprot:TMW67225.1 hypothetical protein Poli38472_012341 [Pythium oligandrum]
MQNALTSGICRSATVPDHLEEAIVVDTARQATQTREDCTDDWLATFQTAFVPPDALPPISALASLLEEQLPSKVPLASKTLERWSGLLSSALRGLFVRNELKTCKAMKRLLVQMAECSPCGGSSTTSYIWFWDSLIRRVLEFVLVTASVERDSSELRPHFLLFLDKECVFRGWEGSGESDVATLRRALESKTSWSFGDDVPYVFGYVAAGELVQLYALSPYSAEKTKIASHMLAQYDLEHKAQRFQLLLALLNLCRLMPTVWLLQIRPDERPNANEALAKLLALEKAETEKTQGQTIKKEMNSY